MSPQRSVLTLILLAVAIGAGWYAWMHRSQWLTPQSLQTLAEQTREVITPPPLRGPLDRLAGTLTRPGVLTETNRHRTADGKKVLTENQKLNEAASAKMRDMFAHQYFDHVGPDKKGPSDWVEGVGYHYIKVGENLALGNFTDDADLVQAWMDSPGHRANILNEDFTEIGIAVGQGVFEGRTTWLAVQSFGLPLSACPTPNSSLEASVKKTEAQLSTTSATLEKLRASIELAASQLANQAAKVEQLADQGQDKVSAGNAKIQQGNATYQETDSREQAQPYWDEGETLQQEGEALLAQAREQQAAYNAAVAAVRQQQETYNQQLDDLQNTQQQLQKNITALNHQIRQFNACASR